MTGKVTGKKLEHGRLGAAVVVLVLGMLAVAFEPDPIAPVVVTPEVLTQCTSPAAAFLLASWPLWLMVKHLLLPLYVWIACRVLLPSRRSWSEWSEYEDK